MYEITPYTLEKARAAGLVVLNSRRLHKKIDVYKDGRYLASVGQIGYKDYPTYIKENGIEYADERRRLYHLRHTKRTWNEVLAKYLLW